MSGLNWWLWLVFGLVLMGLEVFTGAFVMLILGIGATLSALMIWLFSLESLSLQLMVWIINTAIVGGVFYFFYRNNRTHAIGQSNQFLGEVGMVVQAVDQALQPAQLGQVRFQKPILGADLWDCRPQHGTKLEIGERVRLVAFEGHRVVVEPTKITASLE